MDETKKYKSVQLSGLLIGCPYDSKRENCPFKDFRTLPLDQSWEIFRNYNKEKIDQIAAHHNKCRMMQVKI